MPFRVIYDNLFNLISRIAKDYSINIIRADRDFLSCPVMEEINRCISESDYIIAIIGDNHNANVFYELGISHCKKPFSKVLIFKDNSEKYEFDIQHIKQFSFSPKKLKDLDNVIRHFFEYNESADSLINALNSIDAFQQNKSMCVALADYLDKICSSICHDISKLLLSIETLKIDLIPIIHTIRGVVLKEATIDGSIIGEGLIILYANIIARTATRYEHDDDITSLLNNNAIFDAYKFLLTTSLINNNTYIKISVRWLIDYFAKRDTHRIDLTRHRIEEYLVYSKSEEVNTALIDALENESAHVREFCAEVVREKKLFSAHSNLLRQLTKEDNLYTARSIIDAIIAIDCNRNEFHEEDLECIRQWASKLISLDDDCFIKRHLEIAETTFTSLPYGQRQ